MLEKKIKNHGPGLDLMRCFWTLFLFHCELQFGLWVVAGEAALVARLSQTQKLMVEVRGETVRMCTSREWFSPAGGQYDEVEIKVETFIVLRVES